MKRLIVLPVGIAALGLFLIFGGVVGSATADRSIKQAPSRLWPKAADVRIEPFASATVAVIELVPTAMYEDSVAAQYDRQVADLRGWELFALRMQQTIGLSGMYSLLLLLVVFNCAMFWKRWIGPYMEKQWKKSNDQADAT